MFPNGNSPRRPGGHRSPDGVDEVRFAVGNQPAEERFQSTHAFGSAISRISSAAEVCRRNRGQSPVGMPVLSPNAAGVFIVSAKPRPQVVTESPMNSCRNMLFQCPQVGETAMPNAVVMRPATEWTVHVPVIELPAENTCW